MDSIDDTSLPVNERRREIYQRATVRHRARGTPIDDDPLFVALISEWIDGKITLPDIAAQLYSARKSPTAVAMLGSGDNNKMSSDQLLSELQRMIELHDILTA